MELRDMLQILAKQDGSDLYLSTGAPPCAKFNGGLRPLSETPLEPGAWDAVLCLGASFIWGTLAETAAVLHPAVRPLRTAEWSRN